VSDDKMSRVHYDDLEFDDQLALLGDEPFTGVVYANYPDGSLESEFHYIDGLPSGVQRQWHPNGQLEAEWDAIRGHGSAWSRKWHPNGVMKYERINGNRFPVRLREWSEDGQLLKETGPYSQPVDK